MRYMSCIYGNCFVAIDFFNKFLLSSGRKNFIFFADDIGFINFTKVAFSSSYGYEKWLSSLANPLRCCLRNLLISCTIVKDLFQCFFIYGCPTFVFGKNQILK